MSCRSAAKLLAVESWAASWVIGSGHDDAVLDADKQLCIDHGTLQSINMCFCFFHELFYTCKLCSIVHR
jgi:hypothetical protein